MASTVEGLTGRDLLLMTVPETTRRADTRRQEYAFQLFQLSLRGFSPLAQLGALLGTHASLLLGTQSVMCNNEHRWHYHWHVTNNTIIWAYG
jgi:hypothetical protein